MAQSAAAAYRADLGTRDQPFGDVDGDWIAVASVLEHATLVEEPAKSELLRQAISLATNIVGEAEVQRLAEREWQDRDRSASEAIVILVDKVLAAGAFELAETMLDALLESDASLTVVQRGRLLVRHARIAWKTGRLEDSAERFQYIESLARRSKTAELSVRAWLGFASLHQMRGEFEEVRRYTQRAARLAERSGLSRLTREAKVGLVMLAGMARRLDDALIHGWAVYKLSIGDPVDEAEVLQNLGQVLLDCGFVDVARATFAHLASLELPARLMLPALGGLALASAASQHDHTTAWAAHEVLRANPLTVPRYDLASALVECGVGLTQVGRLKTAMRCRTAASELANTHGFGELAAQLEALDAVAPTPNTTASLMTHTLNKRAAQVARELRLMEPKRLPEHVAIAVASA